jgi:hypothetical protein
MKTPLLRLVVTLSLAATAAYSDSPTAVASDQASVDAVAPLLAALPGQRILDRYIMVFRDDTQDAPGLAARLVATHGGKIHHTYRSALRGFAATLPPAAVEALRRNPQVKYVQEDGLSEIGTGSPNRLLNSTLAVPLTVSLYCDPYDQSGGWYGYGSHTCFAYGSGGSGRYSYSWDNAYEVYYDSGSQLSHAEVNCYFHYVYGNSWPITVWVTVTDSDGRTAYAGQTVPCSHW